MAWMSGPLAVQIARLRFFISLAIEQPPSGDPGRLGTGIGQAGVWAVRLDVGGGGVTEWQKISANCVEKGIDRVAGDGV